MNTLLKSSTSKQPPHQLEAGRIRTNLFSFRSTVDFPTREQTRVRNPSCGWRAQWKVTKP